MFVIIVKIIEFTLVHGYVLLGKIDVAKVNIYFKIFIILKNLSD